MKEHNKNWRKAKQHFIDIGEWEKFDKPVMHHVLPCWRYYNLERYNQWNVEDLVVMERNSHAKLHTKGIINNQGENNPNYGKHMSEESKQKSRDTIKRNGGRKGDKNGHYGHHMSDASKDKQRLAYEISGSRKGENNNMFGNGYKIAGDKNGRAKPIKVTNLKTGEVRVFGYKSDPSCAEFLDYSSISSCTASINRAIKSQNGLMKHRTFKVEYLQS